MMQRYRCPEGGFFSLRTRPRTVTRGLPHYVIGKDYQRLRRLVREYDHALSWHASRSRCMLAAQCGQLYQRIYRSYGYFGRTSLGFYVEPRSEGQREGRS